MNYYLDSLPDDTETIDLSNKNLEQLPDLSRFYNLKTLYCQFNNLVSLPELPNVAVLHCLHNNLVSLPELPNVTNLKCYNNPIYNIIEDDIQKLRKLNKFRNFYYSLKYKQQFMNWLWELVRKPKIEQMYHPTNLMKFMNENENWEDEIENW
jgi:Leucine-rich repeat (LRR) protein